MKFKLAVAMLSLSLAAGSAVAQVKPDDAIKFRQSGFTFMAWNMARIKANVDGTYNKEEVIKAANAIQAIAIPAWARSLCRAAKRAKAGRTRA